MTSNIKIANITSVNNKEFSFIDSKIDISKNLLISGKYVDNFMQIDYIGLISILIKGIQELTERINLLESKIK